MVEIPQVFRWIIENDNHRKAIATKSVISDSDRKHYAALRQEKRKQLIPGAEKILQWNRNKGEPA